ncbi:Lysosomal beta glucosidase [Phytophthora cinnamomi]|uniref:Lysosomal beta glucosidase n=1 Tax=Phytophthora cinnamomi TaxID=4785 RepID=UPI003559ADCD|nr:Lysosomal beta glucosidase [Phytophthora cinnamomi]
MKSWLAASMLSLPGVATALSAGQLNSYDAQARAIVDGFSAAQVIGQMTQLDLSLIINGSDHSLNETAVRAFAKLNVGSYLNTNWGDQPINGSYGFNATGFRSMIKRIQEITMEENGGHPMIYGIDSIHGASYVAGAMLFPHEINSGASFNPDLVYKVGQVTARDTEAAGIPWIFGPILDISQNTLWARTYETYGEDPYLASVMGASYVRGLQSYNQTAACVKHFIGYSKTPTGHDRDNVLMSDFDLLNYFMPPFKAAFEAGALSTMENYISLNGDPVVESSRILNDLLRTDLGFEGNMLKENPDQEARLRESAKRVIKMKLQLGLYDNPVPGAEYVSMVGNEKDKETALEMARESIVLLKNENDSLPLPKSSSVFLTGHSADNVGYQCGGWTLIWQGHSGNAMFPHGVSVRKGLENMVGNDSFTYFNGLQPDGSISDADMAKAVQLAGQHKYTIAVIGESSYTEKPGDIDNPALPEGQEKFIEKLAATGTKVVVVLFGGRPRLLGSIPDHAVAIIDGMLPCELGGQAIAEILYGDVNPSGKLPITYPKDPANIAIPYNHRVTTRCMWDNCWMQWDFGAGLSYTKFNYSSVTLDKTAIANADDTLTATVTVTNVGSRAGKETVMLFLIQPYRKISVPEMKMLKKFKKIELQAGESADVSFSLSSEDWGVYQPQIGHGLKRIVEDSNYVVAIKPDTWCNVYGDNITNPLCAQFTIDTSSGAGTVSAGVQL